MHGTMEMNIENAAIGAGLLPNLEAKTSQWFLLTARSGKEADATDWLREREEIPAYWPNYLKTVAVGRKERRRWIKRVCGIVSGFVFVAYCEQPWKLIERVPGALQFLRDPSGRETTLRDSVVEVFRKIEAEQNTPSHERFASAFVHNFQTGQKVRFVDDFTSTLPLGTIKGLAKNGRIDVETKLLGRVIPVSVFAHQIERVGDHD